MAVEYSCSRPNKAETTVSKAKNNQENSQGYVLTHHLSNRGGSKHSNFYLSVIPPFSLLFVLLLFTFAPQLQDNSLTLVMPMVFSKNTFNKFI